jgi:PAB-dependent poly(A)-specific ribonuclease subunit 2
MQPRSPRFDGHAVFALDDSSLLLYDASSNASVTSVPTDSSATTMSACKHNLFAFGDSDGCLNLADFRSPSPIAHRLKAHKGAVSCVDGSGEYLATCGEHSSLVQDQHVRIFDARHTTKPLSTLRFSHGASLLAFSHLMPSSLLLASGSTGAIMLADAQLGASQWASQEDSASAGLLSLTLSPTGTVFALGDGGGLLHLYASSTRSSAQSSLSGIEAEDPPLRPPGSQPQDEHAPVPEVSPPELLQADSLLSDVKPSNRVSVGLGPRQMPKAISEALANAGFMSFVRNPLYNRSNPQGEAKRKVYAAMNRRAGSQRARHGSARKAVPDAYLYSEVGESTQAFTRLNHTALAGLENGLPNCYANAVLQVMHFNFELRNGALSHLCERDACITCELNFLIHMLRSTPRGGSCQPQNLLRSLRQVQEASALGLLECNNQLEAQIDVPLARRVQGFQRFLLEQLHKEQIPSPLHADRTIPEEAFGTTAWQVTECTTCSHSTERTQTTFQVELEYSGAPERKAQSGQEEVLWPTFASLLQQSIAHETQLRAWCHAERKYTRMKQLRILTSPPKTLVVSCGVPTTPDLGYWGVYPSAKPEDGRKYFGNEFLPFCIRVLLDKEHRRSRVEQADSPDELSAWNDERDKSSSNTATYVLWALVSVVRDRIPELDRNEAVGSPSEPDSRHGEMRHVVAHVNVDEEYLQGQRARQDRSTNQDEDIDKDEPGWYVLNDATIEPTSDDEVRRMYGINKNPVLAYYRRIDEEAHATHHDRADARVLDQSQFFRLSTPKVQSMKLQPLQPNELRSIRLLGLDAEFVALTPPEIDVSEDGFERTIRPSRLGLGRVSVVRGEGSSMGLACIDEYVNAVEPVYDHLTKFSGLVRGDLEPLSTRKNLVTLKEAYLKLRFLVDSGFVFIGHGLSKDFRMINISVPDEQVLDTVELFRLPSSRRLSLRFLAAFILGVDVQAKTHDSIEDAHVAVQLYKVYNSLQRKGRLEKTLREMYRAGKTRGWVITSDLLQLGRMHRSEHSTEISA